MSRIRGVCFQSFGLIEAAAHDNLEQMHARHAPKSILRLVPGIYFALLQITCMSKAVLHRHIRARFDLDYEFRSN